VVAPRPEAQTARNEGGWPALPARGQGIEAFRQELEAARAVLETRRVSGAIDDREYAREMRTYYQLYRAYRQRVR